MGTATPADLYCGEPAGATQLRAALTEHLGRICGLRTSPAYIGICAATVHGLALLARALADGGHICVGIEDPGWARLRPLLVAVGLASVLLARAYELGDVNRIVALLTDDVVLSTPLAAS